MRDLRAAQWLISLNPTLTHSSIDTSLLPSELAMPNFRPSPDKSSRKLAHSFDFAKFITIALSLSPQRTFGMCDRCAGNFPRGARNRKVAEAAK
jgi:hypothetical protein